MIVGDVDHRHPHAFVDVPDLVLHLLAELAVERTERLVHEHDLRLEDQCSRNCHALLLPPRKLVRPPVPEAAKLHHVEHPGDAPLDLRLARLAHLQGVGDVLEHRHVREQGVVLEHHADVALVRRQVVDGAPFENDVAVGGGFESGEHHQAGGLARPGRTQHGQEFTAVDVEVEFLDDEGFPVVALLNVLELDEGFVVRHVTLSSPRLWLVVRRCRTRPSAIAWEWDGEGSMAEPGRIAGPGSAGCSAGSGSLERQPGGETLLQLVLVIRPEHVVELQGVLVHVVRRQVALDLGIDERIARLAHRTVRDVVSDPALVLRRCVLAEQEFLRGPPGFGAPLTIPMKPISHTWVSHMMVSGWFSFL